MEFNKRQEEIVDILCSRTGNNDRSFFRVMVAYKFAEIATNMRANVEFAGSTNIPCNVYALDLAPSGYSKNASMNILDKEIFDGFKKTFMSKTFLDVSDNNLALLAGDLSTLSGIDIKDASHTIRKEFDGMPKYLYSFGSSTPEGFKAMRAKLSMAGIGATSNVIDEIGSNLTGNQETMTVQLEAYDMGDSKQKLIKTDGGNSDMRGSVPSNLFAFGTQSKLLDGSTTEHQFFELLETGYARRFIVGFVDKHERETGLSAEEMFDEIMSPTAGISLLSFSKYFEELSDKSYWNRKITLSRDVSIKLMQYRIDCDKKADKLREHEEILKAVIKHAYWRALKLAGAYAFIEKSSEVTEELLENAIALVDDSIANFKKMLSREKPYVRLAKYISQIGKPVTQVDLLEDLIFYKGSESQKREMMQLAIAYGYNNNIIIKSKIRDGIEFLEGEALQETDLNRVSCSWSKDIAEGYTPAESSFDKLHQLVSGTGFHYCSHNFKDGHRKTENVIEGFNLLILDVDSGLSIDVAKSLLSKYTYLIATTKRHTETHNRYRIVLPMSHTLKLNAKDYKQFMKNVFDFLPIQSDEQTGEIARKWQSHKGEYFYNSGELIDVLQFIPDTSKEKSYRDKYNSIGSVDDLQRWFLMNFNPEEGRNNLLIKYALALFDDGLNSDTIRHSVYDLNSKLDEPLQEKEIEATVMKTIIRKEFERESE